VSASNYTSNLAKTTSLQRLRGGLASTFIFQVLSATEAILLVPLFLRAWGADGYGEWLTLTAFISYLMLVDLGVQNYLANLLTMAYAAGDLASFKKYLNETLSLFVLICSALMLLVALIMALPGISLPSFEQALSLDQRLIFVFLAGSYLLSVFGGVWATVYRATGRFTRGAMVGNVWGIIKLIVLISALVLQGSPLVYALLYFGTTALRLVYYFFDIYSTIPEARGVYLSMTNAQRGKSYLGGSFFFWLKALSAGINQQGVISVLAASLPAAMVSVYATHRTASGLVRYPFMLVQSPLWPELSMLGGQERLDRLREISLLVVQLIVFVSSLAALGLWVWLPVIYKIWTSNELELRPALLALFLVQVVLFAGWSSTAWPLLAINKHKELATWDIVNAVFTILLSLVLVIPLDIYGVAIATFLGDILCGLLVYPRLTARHLGLPASAVFRAVLDPVLAFGAVAVLIGVADVFLAGWLLVIVSSLCIALAVYPLAVLIFGRGAVTKSMRMLLQSPILGRFQLHATLD